MRPAVSVGRATALDGFNTSHSLDHLSSLSNDPVHQYNLEGYFDAPDPSESDRYLLENGILAEPNVFDLNYDHLAFDNDGALDDFNINEYLHHDENNQPAPEVQSSDSVAESTSSLQPPFGASTYGCDDGSNAVSV